LVRVEGRAVELVLGVAVGFFAGRGAVDTPGAGGGRGLGGGGVVGSAGGSGGEGGQ
jgi:hypothetical protein